jgi:hypothetical protein
LFHDLRLPKGLCTKCGGKIAIFYVQNPENPNDQNDQLQVRRCYQVDPYTQGFLNPTKKTLPIETLVSDPPVRVDGQSLENVPEAAEGDYGAQEPNIPEKFNLPLVEHVDTDPQGREIAGTRTTIQLEQVGVTAIPMNCDAHDYLNPFTSEVLFNDTFPKDKKEQMDLFAIQINLKLVSRAYVLTQIGVENVNEMLQAVEQEQQKEFERTLRLNAALNGLSVDDSGNPLPPAPVGRPPARAAQLERPTNSNI